MLRCAAATPDERSGPARAVLWESAIRLADTLTNQSSTCCSCEDASSQVTWFSAGCVRVPAVAAVTPHAAARSACADGLRIRCLLQLVPSGRASRPPLVLANSPLIVAREDLPRPPNGPHWRSHASRFAFGLSHPTMSFSFANTLNCDSDLRHVADLCKFKFDALSMDEQTAR